MTYDPSAVSNRDKSEAYVRVANFGWIEAALALIAIAFDLNQMVIDFLLVNAALVLLLQCYGWRASDEFVSQINATAMRAALCFLASWSALLFVCRFVRNYLPSAVIPLLGHFDVIFSATVLVYFATFIVAGRRAS